MTSLSQSSWSIDQLFDLFPEYRRSVESVRRCIEPVTGSGRFVRHSAGENIVAEVNLHATPAARFSAVIAAAARSATDSPDNTVLVRAILRGILEGTTQFEPPAWGCRIECTAANSNPFSDLALAVASSMAVRSMLNKPGWEPPDPTGDSVAAAKRA